MVTDLHPPNEETVITERRARVAQMYLQGKSQYAIGKEVGVDHSTVSRDLSALREVWRASANLDFSEFQARELAKIDHMEAKAWEAWEKSERDREVSTAEKTTGRRSGTKSSIRREGQTGNEGYMKVIQWCIEKRREYMGWKLPEKIAITDITGTKDYGADGRGGPLATLLGAARSAVDRRRSGTGDGSDGVPGDAPAIVDSADRAADAGVSE